MKIVRNILGAVWATWGLVIFTSTLLIVILPIWLTSFIKEPAGTEWFRRISKAWMTVFLFFIGSPLRIRGRHNVKKHDYVIVCNHNSFMDVPVTTPFIPGANKTIAKESMAKIPLFGIIYKRGAVLVNRSSNESRRRSYEEMKRVLSKGMHMVIYPEGTRNRSEEPLKSFFDGAFNLAVETQREVLPAVIFHTKTVLPPDKAFYLRPHRLEMHFLPPVSPIGITPKELKDKVFRQMWDYYSAHR